MTRLSESEVKELVKDHYAEVARGASSCCDDSCCTTETKLYALEEVEGLPDEAVMASAGCGNPTAIGELNAGETVVDFGSGGGMDCFLAAKSVGPRGRVIGIDMTQEMIDLARRNAKKVGADNVEFHLAGIENTPLEEACADVILSNCVICLAPDKDAVFAEAFRLLCNGGRLFVSDIVRAQQSTGEDEIDEEHCTTCASPSDTKSTYLERLRRAGFTDIEVLSEISYDDPTAPVAVLSVNVTAHKS